MWVTTSINWQRKSAKQNRIGHHSHFLLVVKKNGLSGRCSFSSPSEFMWISAQSVNLAKGGKWLHLDGIVQVRNLIIPLTCLTRSYLFSISSTSVVKILYVVYIKLYYIIRIPLTHLYTYM